LIGLRLWRGITMAIPTKFVRAACQQSRLSVMPVALPRFNEVADREIWSS